MRRTGIPGEDDKGASGAGDNASDLGWDDSLYEGRPGVPGPRKAEDAPGPRGAGEPPRRGHRAARRKRKPMWRRVLFWTSASLAVVVAGVAVAGFLYIRHLNDNITKKPRTLGSEELEKPPPNADGQSPLNILLLGSDSREGEENQRLGGARDLAGGPVRADVQMLLHASADRSNMTLISIPRDTQVAIPECTDPDTGEVYSGSESASINTALSNGGPGCVLATWEELTGLYIDHFMMVDFEGVVEMADAVGGVPVCVEENVADDKSGLRLEAGESVLEGEGALQWLRTRKAFGDGSDIGRTRAQQMYLSNMVDELQSSASLTNTGELMDLAEAATSALTVDHELGSVQALYDLGEDLRRVPNDRFNMVTLPWLPDPADPEVTIIPDPQRAEELFALVRGDIPLDDQDAVPAEPSPEETSENPGGDANDPDPVESVRVAVRNATGSDMTAPVNGRAGVITDELVGLGYALAGTDTSITELAAKSEVRYAEPEDRANAEALAEALGMPADRVMVSPSATDVTLVIGEDWREGTTFPEPVEEPEETRSDDPAVTEDEIISGSGGVDCMPVNPLYTW
ncbi:LCP family protein [Streptomyces sp. NBRC 109706]|uniref:LCP family protein n=1 Tax=Streptomyces sp. NBRC 109706 TaxID=1550035 RepID=UPI00099DA771|nr:LCP family protein [Streptomyces sp. NBRC 109706]